MSKIELTVGLPMYRAGQIGWLPLEGLCAQEGVDFAWELLVIEEPDNAFGQKRLERYRPRLKAAGCARVHYVELPEWVPLARKWAMMGTLAASTSKCFLLHGADDYSEPRRLRATLDAFRVGDVDWLCYRQGMFYNIQSGATAVYCGEAGEGAHGVNIGIRTELMRNLPDADVRRFVDAWLFTTISVVLCGKTRVRRIDDDAWKAGLYTNGQNQLSLGRTHKVESCIPPYHRSGVELGVPAPIVQRLCWLGGRAKERMHTEWWPPEGYGRFAREYFTDFVRSLLADERVEFTTYDDLGRKPSKTRVVLNHDVDASPERTLEALEFEAKLGIVSSVMLFRECVDNVHFQQTRELRLVPYDVDWARLRELHQCGFRFGYHCNAYERADFDFEAAHDLAGEDIAWLKGRIPLSYYSAHGGLRGPGGEANRTMKPDPAWGLMPAHNCIGNPKLPSYTDTKLITGTLTPFEFAAQMQPGAVYRILLHPQYYHTPCKAFRPGVPE